MNSARIVLTAVIIVACVSTGGVASQESQQAFQSALANYYGISDTEVQAIMSSGLTPNDIPVALFFSKAARMSLSQIIKLRKRGDSWAELADTRGLNPQDFYVIAVGEIPSKTYAPIFAKYKSTPIQYWHKIELTDDDIVNLVNLRFISSHHDWSIFDVMTLRDVKRNFMDINSDVQGRKAEWVKKENEKKRNSVVAASEE